VFEVISQNYATIRDDSLMRIFKPMHAVVISKLDNCHAAARVLMRTSRRDHVYPVLASPH